MPTLHSYPAGTTTQATILVQHWWMFCSQRLIWQVTFSGCVRTRGRISTTCKKKGWLPWTCILFKLLSRLLSMCVPWRKPMRNPARKLLGRARQEPSSPVLELQSRFPRKSASRSPANYARNMEARIPHTLPRTVTGTLNGKRWYPRCQEGRQETQSSKAVIRPVEQEIG